MAIMSKRDLTVFSMGVCIFTVAIGLVVLQRWAPSLSAGPIVEEKVLAAQDPPPLPESVEKLDSLNLLLLGSGGAGHEGGELTDAIILAHIDFKQAKIALISIPRDLWIGDKKINHWYSSSYDSLRDALATVTGFSPNYFIAVDFVGFQRAMGYVLDGIEVDVGQDFSDPWYPTEGKQLEPCGHSPEEIAELTAKYSDFELQKQFPCRYEKIEYKKGIVRMNGGDALKYVRSRHSSSDFDRSRRQFEILVGVKNKLFGLNAWDDAGKFFLEFIKYTQSDINVEVAKYLAPALKMSRDFEIVSINLSTENILQEDRAGSGAFILKPRESWERVREYIEKEL